MPGGLIRPLVSVNSTQTDLLKKRPPSVDENHVDLPSRALRALLLCAAGVGLTLAGVGPVAAQGDEIDDDPFGHDPNTPSLETPHIDFAEDTDPTEIRQVTDRVIAMNASIETDGANRSTPPDLDFAGAAGDYALEYSTAIPSGHAAVFEAVMDEWSNAVDFNGGGIHVQVIYQSLGFGALAGASHYSVLDGPSGAPYTIPTALRNAQRGSDQFPSTPDIVVYVNTDQNWSTVIGGSIGNSQYSLYATLLHEIGHGLGVSSDLDPNSAAGDFFSSFDHRLYRDQTSSTTAGPSSPIFTIASPAVTTDRQWFLNLDGTWERVFDPSTGYQGGSSMSHLDEASYPRNSAGALMTPTLFNGEIVGGVDAVTLGLMEGIGWTIEQAPAAPTVSSVSVAPGLINVAVSPSLATTAPPAVQWSVVVRNSSGTAVGSFAFPAHNRTLSLPLVPGDGSYTVEVSGVGSGGSSAAGTRSFVLSGQPPAPSYDNCRQAPVNPAFGTADETNAAVYRLYCAYFLRYPDQGGFGYWLSEFSSGARDLDDISEFFAVSTEFQTRYGSLTDAQFVDLIYTNILEREPEPTGYNFWLGELQSGNRTRGWLMLFFSQSDEFRIKTGTFT